jgi:hypothetical protein
MKRTGLSSVASTAKVIAASIRKAVVGAVQGLIHALKHVVLNQKLSSNASVDAVVVVQEARQIIINLRQLHAAHSPSHSLVVENVPVSEAERRSARVQVLPLVVCVRHLDRCVLILVVVRVTDERRLPVIMQVRVGDRDGIAAMGDVEQTIVVVLVVVTVRRELDRVDPDTVRSLDGDVVTSIGKDLADL